MMADKKKELREKLEKIIESGDEEAIRAMGELLTIICRRLQSDSSKPDPMR